MANDDLLTDLWRVLARQVGTSAADRELLGLRQRWGGTRVYLKKTPAAPAQNDLGAQIASGKRVREAIAAVGCSAAWGHRLLSRRPIR
jgi:hypothetical protein